MLSMSSGIRRRTSKPIAVTAPELAASSAAFDVRESNVDVTRAAFAGVVAKVFGANFIICFLLQEEQSSVDIHIGLYYKHFLGEVYAGENPRMP